MRKLRRLPWRIPKSHDKQPASSASAYTGAEQCARVEPERRSYRDEEPSQPVAFAGGRYVYGDAPSVSCHTEIRRKARHRVVLAGA
ncbi:MAG TPA: hypothetical protein VHP37_02710 [Burkholderiales bacterium]|jgi:hypothetical protein|nr:hypothetical protein [Burkholderiales bacterium]